MPLSPADYAEIERIAADGTRAGDLLPFLRRLAVEDRVADMPSAVESFTQRLETNRRLARRFLIQRLPAILVNHYWPRFARPVYPSIVRWMLKTEDWSQGILDAADRNDGEGLVAAVKAIELRASEIGR